MKVIFFFFFPTTTTARLEYITLTCKSPFRCHHLFFSSLQFFLPHTKHQTGSIPQPYLGTYGRQQHKSVTVTRQALCSYRSKSQAVPIGGTRTERGKAVRLHLSIAHCTALLFLLNFSFHFDFIPQPRIYTHTHTHTHTHTRTTHTNTHSGTIHNPHTSTQAQRQRKPTLLTLRFLRCLRGRLLLPCLLTSHWHATFALELF